MGYFTRIYRLAKALLIAAGVVFAAAVYFLVYACFTLAAILGAIAVISAALNLILRTIAKDMEYELLFLRSDFNKQLQRYRTEENINSK